MERYRTQNSLKKKLPREEKVGGITLSDMKIFYVAPIIKTVWSCQRDRHMENDGTQKRT